MPTKRNTQVPVQRMEMNVIPNTARRDEQGHVLIDVVWSTGAPVVRYPWWDDPYIEELSLDSEHVELGRLNNGASVLNNHKSHDLSFVLGTVLRESAKVDGEKGTATVRLSKRKDIEGIVEDIEAGIISKISVGYIVKVFEEHLPEAEGKLRTLKAIKWEPLEISFVCIPADDGSESRASEEGPEENPELFECVIISRERRANMPPVEPTQNPTEPKNAPVDNSSFVEEGRQKGAQEQRQRNEEISTLCRNAGLDAEFILEMTSSERSVGEVKDEIITKLAKKDEQKPTRSAVAPVEITQDEKDIERRSVESALLHRIDPKNELEFNGRNFASLTMIEMARQMQGRDAVGADRREIAARALSHSSDLPNILSNIAGKTLGKAYESAPRTFLPLARKEYHADFKGVTRVQLEDQLSLEKLLEGGIIKHGSLGDSKESYNIVSYAKQFSFTREMIINDDLGAFLQIPRVFGRNASDLESEIFWNEFQTGTMADNKAIYHADHNNLITGAAAISEESIDALEQLLANQLKANGKPMNLIARYLVVPRSKRNAAKKLLGLVNATKTADVNVYENAFDLISEVRLTGNRFYVSADYNQIDTFEIGYLMGNEGVSIEQGMDFDTRGIKMSAVHDFAAKCINHRGVAAQTLA